MLLKVVGVATKEKYFRFSATISSILLTFVVYTCCAKACFLLQKKRQGSTSSPPLGQPTSSTTSLPSPWTCKYRSLLPLISVPAFKQASSGVRRGRILGMKLCERSPEDIRHLCQQHCICNHLNSQRASISLLIKIKNRSIHPHSFFISPTGPFEVSDVINALKSGKSIGPNSIPIKLLKIISPYFSSPLSQIINEPFQSGIYPEKMQHAKVIPLFKKGYPETVSNYRPISLLSVFSKITEKLMYKRLYHFLNVHEII